MMYTRWRSKNISENDEKLVRWVNDPGSLNDEY